MYIHVHVHACVPTVMSQVPIVWVVIKALSLAYCVMYMYINKEMHV